MQTLAAKELQPFKKKIPKSYYGNHSEHTKLPYAAEAVQFLASPVKKVLRWKRKWKLIATWDPWAASASLNFSASGNSYLMSSGTDLDPPSTRQKNKTMWDFSDISIPGLLSEWKAAQKGKALSVIADWRYLVTTREAAFTTVAPKWWNSLRREAHLAPEFYIFRRHFEQS